MEFVAAMVVPLFVFLLPILLLLSYVAPSRFGADEIWALQGPCILLLPLSTPLWWIFLRRITGQRGGFVAPWIVSFLTAIVSAPMILWRLR